MQKVQSRCNGAEQVQIWRFKGCAEEVQLKMQVSRCRCRFAGVQVCRCAGVQVCRCAGV